MEINRTEESDSIHIEGVVDHREWRKIAADLATFLVQISPVIAQYCEDKEWDSLIVEASIYEGKLAIYPARRGNPLAMPVSIELKIPHLGELAAQIPAKDANAHAHRLHEMSVQCQAMDALARSLRDRAVKSVPRRGLVVFWKGSASRELEEMPLRF